MLVFVNYLITMCMNETDDAVGDSRI